MNARKNFDAPQIQPWELTKKMSTVTAISRSRQCVLVLCSPRRILPTPGLTLSGAPMARPSWSTPWLTHVSMTYLSDIDTHSLVASYECEAHKKVLSTFYIAHNILTMYVAEGTPKPPPPCGGAFRQQD